MGRIIFVVLNVECKAEGKGREGASSGRVNKKRGCQKDGRNGGRRWPQIFPQTFQFIKKSS